MVFVPLLLALSSLLTLAFGPPKLVESDAGKLPIYPSQLGLIREATPPQLQGSAFLIMDAATERVVFQRNARKRLAPASITKIMTAILALEGGNLQEKVSIKGEYMMEGSSMGLLPGDVVTLEDLLWGLLLPSGNDAAMAIAAHLGGGSVERFVQRMNERAAQLGLKDTQFKNPHGLDEEGHYSTAYDLAEMARYALGKPLFAKMVATNNYTVRASRTFFLENSNFLLRRQAQAPGVNGVKSGLTDDAGDCLVASATRHGHQVITVAMGTSDRTWTSIQLLDYAFSGFGWINARTPAYLYHTDGRGARHALVLAETKQKMLSSWERSMVNASVELDGEIDGLAPRSQVGRVSYWLGAEKLEEVPLFLAAP